MRHLQLTILLISSISLPAIVNAVPISASYDVNLDDADPGLVVNSSDVADKPFSFDLSAGESEIFTLFQIGTDESAVNGDDEVPRPISVDFSFTLPEVTTGSVSGTTSGETEPDPLFGVSDFYQRGVLNWGSPLELVFGALSDGLLRISLSDTEFNEGAFWGLGDHGADVIAKVEVVSEPSAVPEPGTLALMGLAIVGVGVRSRRRKAWPKQ